MLNLNLLLTCCCNQKQDDEDPENISTHTLGKKLPRTEHKNPDESIIAAPFPLQGKDTMGFVKLTLKILESTTVMPGTLLKITSAGLEDSKRNKNDSKVFFGSQLIDKGQVINDYVIEEGHLGMGKQHFLIKFHSSNNSFTISDLGDGTGTFVKLSQELTLRDGFIISFSNNHLKVSISEAEKKLALRFLDGAKINEEYSFGTMDGEILIGRMNDCKIRFEDSNMSRHQCNICFKEEIGWVLSDGGNRRNSTNGTWIYVEEEFEVSDKMIFKAGKTLFEAILE